MRITWVCLGFALVGCAEPPPPIEAVKAPPAIEIPADLREHCMSTAAFPLPPRLPRTPEGVVKWADAVQTTATKALIVCDRKREDLLSLIEMRNEQVAHLTKP
jgi:hypothetical protein